LLFWLSSNTLFICEVLINSVDTVSNASKTRCFRVSKTEHYSDTVSVRSVLKWRARLHRHLSIEFKNPVDEHPIWNWETKSRASAKVIICLQKYLSARKIVQAVIFLCFLPIFMTFWQNTKIDLWHKLPTIFKMEFVIQLFREICYCTNPSIEKAHDHKEILWPKSNTKP
jgi:hypothetical protein